MGVYLNVVLHCKTNTAAANQMTVYTQAIASETKAKFFSISASSLMSKWIGEGEKMVGSILTRYREKSN